MLCFWNELAYRPVAAQADNDEIASRGERLMLLHTTGIDSPVLFVAPKAILHAGLVIGIME